MSYQPHPRQKPSILNRTQAKKILALERQIKEARAIIKEMLNANPYQQVRIREFIQNTDKLLRSK